MTKALLVMAARISPKRLSASTYLYDVPGGGHAHKGLLFHQLIIAMSGGSEGLQGDRRRSPSVGGYFGALRESW